MRSLSVKFYRMVCALVLFIPFLLSKTGAYAQDSNAFVLQSVKGGYCIQKLYFAKKGVLRFGQKWRLPGIDVESWRQIHAGFPHPWEISPRIATFLISPQQKYLVYIVSRHPKDLFAIQLKVFDLMNRRLIYSLHFKNTESVSILSWLKEGTLAIYKKEKMKPQEQYLKIELGKSSKRVIPLSSLERQRILKKKQQRSHLSKQQMNMLDQRGYFPSGGFEQGYQTWDDKDYITRSLGRNYTLVEVHASKVNRYLYLAKDQIKGVLDFPVNVGVRRAFFKENWLVVLSDQYEPTAKRQLEIWSLTPFRRCYQLNVLDLCLSNN